MNDELRDAHTEFTESLRQVGPVAAVLARSAGVMFSGLGRWVVAEKGETAGRVVFVSAVGFPAVYLTGDRPWLWGVYGGAWFLGCTTIARRLWTEQQAEDQEGEEEKAEKTENGLQDHQENDLEAGEWDDEDAPDAVTEPPAPVTAAAAHEAFREFIEHNVAAAVKQRRKGIHTKTLLALLHSSGMLLDWDETALRAKCADLGITVRRQLNIKGANGFGIHIDDLTADLGRAPRLPASLVPDLTPGSPSVGTPDEEPTAPPVLTLLKPPTEAA